MNATRIGPSLLAADFARLAEDIGRVERGGADFLHLDVMDGHFVPNISFGLPVVAAVRQTTRLELNTHLMLQDPLPFIGPFKEAGADSLVVHVELESAQAVLDAIRQHGLQCGLAVNPNTPVSALYPYLDELDSVLVMSVEPGFGGQAFQPAALDKNPRPVRGNRAPWTRHTRRHRRRSPARQRGRLPPCRCPVPSGWLSRLQLP